MGRAIGGILTTRRGRVKEKIEFDSDGEVKGEEGYRGAVSASAKRQAAAEKKSRRRFLPAKPRKPKVPVRRDFWKSVCGRGHVPRNRRRLSCVGDRLGNGPAANRPPLSRGALVSVSSSCRTTVG